MASRDKSAQIIGWSEYVDLPKWGIGGLQAKVDTGARTSALHVDNLEEAPGGYVTFDVVLSRRNPGRRIHVRAKVDKWAKVRSSTGKYSKRCFVTTCLRLGPVEKEIQLSLVSRERMIFRMLLGRKALEDDFLVDAGRRKILGVKPSRKSSVKKPV